MCDERYDDPDSDANAFDIALGPLMDFAFGDLSGSTSRLRPRPSITGETGAVVEIIRNDIGERPMSRARSTSSRAGLTAKTRRTMGFQNQVHASR